MREEARAHKQKLQELFSQGRRFAYDKEEVILRAGDIPSGVYYIDRGFIKVYSITDRGEENLHIIYRPGEIFPMIWTFKDRIRDIFYEAIAKTSLLRIPRETFLEAIKKDAGLGFAVSSQIVDQFYAYADRVENLEYRNAYQRVVYRLLFLASRFGEKENGQIVIKAPLTHQHIANSINIVRETASRELEKLELKGLIAKKGQYLVIKNIRALQTELKNYIDFAPWTS